MMILKCLHCVMRMCTVLLTHKHTRCITVKFAINTFKPGKSDSTDGLLSDNFLVAYILYVAILHYYLPVC